MIRKLVSVIIISLLLVVSFAFISSSKCQAGMLLKFAHNSEDPVTGEAITVQRFKAAWGGYWYWFASYDNVKKFKNLNDYQKKQVMDRVEIRNAPQEKKKSEPLVRKVRKPTPKKKSAAKVKPNRKSWWD